MTHVELTSGFPATMSSLPQLKASGSTRHKAIMCGRIRSENFLLQNNSFMMLYILNIDWCSRNRSPSLDITGPNMIPCMRTLPAFAAVACFYDSGFAALYEILDRLYVRTIRPLKPSVSLRLRSAHLVRIQFTFFTATLPCYMLVIH